MCIEIDDRLLFQIFGSFCVSSYLCAKEELEELRSRSQFATMKKGRGSNFKYLPYAFTLLGVSMLSSVLESDTAIEANRRIMPRQQKTHKAETHPI